MYRQDSGDTRKVLAFQSNGTILAFGLKLGSAYAELDVPTTPAHWTDGSWHHVAATYDGTTKRVYKDGVEIGSATATGAIAAELASAHIGSTAAASDFFAGTIDEVRLSSIARPAEELYGHWRAGASGAQQQSVAGTVVAITGTNFGAAPADSLVTFNGFPVPPADIVSWTVTELHVKVPAGAASGNVHVTVDGITSNPAAYTIEGLVAITAE